MKTAKVVALVVMPWRGEAKLAADLDDADGVLVDRWYTTDSTSQIAAVTFCGRRLS